MGYSLNGFFNIEVAADAPGNARFLGGQAEHGRCELRPHTLHEERKWTTWHIAPCSDGTYTLSVLDPSWREVYLRVRDAESPQLDLAEADEGESTRWRISNAGDTGIGKSYVTIENVLAGKCINADVEHSGNVGLDEAFNSGNDKSGSLWQLLQLVTVAGPLPSWIEQVEEPSPVAGNYT